MCFSPKLNGKAMFKETVTVTIIYLFFLKSGMQEKDTMKQSSHGGCLFVFN